MAKKIFTYRGKKIEELQALTLEQFAELLPSAQRRKVNRGFTEAEQKLLKDIEKNPKNVKINIWVRENTRVTV